MPEQIVTQSDQQLIVSDSNEYYKSLREYILNPDKQSPIAALNIVVNKKLGADRGSEPDMRVNIIMRDESLETYRKFLGIEEQYPFDHQRKGGYGASQPVSYEFLKKEIPGDIISHELHQKLGLAHLAKRRWISGDMAKQGQDFIDATKTTLLDAPITSQRRILGGAMDVATRDRLSRV